MVSTNLEMVGLILQKAVDGIEYLAQDFPDSGQQDQVFRWLLEYSCDDQLPDNQLLYCTIYHGSNGIRQWQINKCTSLIMIHKITPSVK